MATSAQLKWDAKSGYAAMIANTVMAWCFADNWRSIGIEACGPKANGCMGFDRFGNVSQAMPSISPYIAIAPEATTGHTAEFREASISPSGHAGLIKAAKATAMIASDLLASPELLQAAQAEFATAVERR